MCMYLSAQVPVDASWVRGRVSVDVFSIQGTLTECLPISTGACGC